MKKLIIRADDFGYTKTHNDGTMEAIDNGVVTSVDIMLDTPGSIDAMERIKSYPWISMGWHSHFWGAPVLDPTEVPSMVNEEGRFKFRKDQKLKDTCDYDEVVKECRAQLERCLEICGRIPDYTWISNPNSLFEKARMQVCDEYGIIYNWASKPNRDGILVEANDKYKHLNIYMPNQPATTYKVCYEDSYAVRSTYDPVKDFTEDKNHIMDKEIALVAYHPGYLDSYVLAESSMNLPRVKDVEALTSPILKQWIINNQIELVNTTDAIYGKQDYQNHLKHINSPLYIKKS